MSHKESQTSICARCNKMFMYPGFGLRYCPTCKKFDEEDFDKVRDYIYAHGTATMLEIEDKTGVANKRINQYLREGRLEIPNNSPIFIKCDVCRTDIRSGRYCKACASKLSKDLQGGLYKELEVGEEPKKLEGKMRFHRN